MKNEIKILKSREKCDIIYDMGKETIITWDI